VLVAPLSLWRVTWPLTIQAPACGCGSTFAEGRTVRLSPFAAAAMISWSSSRAMKKTAVEVAASAATSQMKIGKVLNRCLSIAHVCLLRPPLCSAWCVRSGFVLCRPG
jgi:hypothetical protein